MASTSKNRSSSTMPRNPKSGNVSITSQSKRQDRNTGGMIEAAKKRGRTGEDHQETEAPLTKRQAVPENANDQEDACVSTTVLDMSSELAKLDAMATAISKFKTNTGHFEVAMKNLFENTVEQELKSGICGDCWWGVTFNSPSLHEVSKWLSGAAYDRLVEGPDDNSDPDEDYAVGTTTEKLLTYEWACAIRPILHEDTGFDLEQDSPADGAMLPIIWRTVLLAQGSFIDDWIRKYEADGYHQVRKGKHGAEYLKVEIHNVGRWPSDDEEDERREQGTTPTETEPLLIPGSIWD